jgi:hypothetical protein
MGGPFYGRAEVPKSANRNTGDAEADRLACDSQLALMTGQTVLDRNRIAAQIRRHSGSVAGLRKSGTTGTSVTGILLVIGRVGPGLHAPENVVPIELGGVRQLELPTIARTGSSTSEWLKVE